MAQQQSRETETEVKIEEGRICSQSQPRKRNRMKGKTRKAMPVSEKAYSGVGVDHIKSVLFAFCLLLFFLLWLLVCVQGLI